MSTSRYLLILCMVLLGFPSAVQPQDEYQEYESQIPQLRSMLKYGVDTEIIEQLPFIIQHRLTELSPEVQTIAAESSNPTLLTAAFRYFRELELFGVEKEAERILHQAENHPESLILEVLRYVKSSPSVNSSLGDHLRTLANDPRVTVARSAIDALGTHGTLEDGKYLVSLFNNLELASDIRGGAILAVGNLNYNASESLIAILADTTEELYLRRYAAISLGKLQLPEVFDQLTAYINDPQALLRAEVIAAVSTYPQEEVDPILRQALRDSHWQIRLRAIEGIQERATPPEFIQIWYDIIVYKALHDPDWRVQQDAIMLLFHFANAQVYQLFKESVANPALTLGQRTFIAQLLVQSGTPDHIEFMRMTIAPEIDYTRSQFLHQFSQRIAKTDAPHATPLYRSLLKSKTRTAVLFSLQGIAYNNLQELTPAINELIDHNSDLEIQRSAQLLLERWNTAKRE